MSVTDSGLVRASGVVVVRDTGHGPEVVVIHRDLRADWSLPKGKLEPGEHPLTAAVRECDEETGIVPILGPPLPRQEYVALGSPKIVDYWSARVGGDEGFAPDEEVAEILWLPAEEAAARLTYPRDADLIREAAAMPSSSPFILLRHTQSTKRADYGGKVDAERPLSGKGRSQAKALVPLLSAYGITSVHSSDSARCRETVRRYAKSIDARVELEPSLSEEAHDDRPKRAARRMRQLTSESRASRTWTWTPNCPPGASWSCTVTSRQTAGIRSCSRLSAMTSPVTKPVDRARTHSSDGPIAFTWSSWSARALDIPSS